MHLIIIVWLLGGMMHHDNSSPRHFPNSRARIKGSPSFPPSHHKTLGILASMGLVIRTSLPVFLLLVILLTSGVGKGLRDGVISVHSLHKDNVRASSRKLLILDSLLDYDDAGANTKHDPRKGKPGGGKNR